MDSLTELRTRIDVAYDVMLTASVVIPRERISVEQFNLLHSTVEALETLQKSFNIAD